MTYIASFPYVNSDVILSQPLGPEADIGEARRLLKRAARVYRRRASAPYANRERLLRKARAISSALAVLRDLR